MKTIDFKAFEAIQSEPKLAETAAKLFYLAATEPQSAVFLNQAMPQVSQALGAEFLALVHGEKGIWRTLASVGVPRGLPAELLAESLDADGPITRGDWYVAPLQPRSGSGEMICVYRLKSVAAAEAVTLWLAE